MKKLCILLIHVCSCACLSSVILKPPGELHVTKSFVDSRAVNSTYFHIEWILESTRDVKIHFIKLPSCFTGVKLTILELRTKRMRRYCESDIPTDEVFYGNAVIKLFGSRIYIVSSFVVKLSFDYKCENCGHTFTLPADGSSTLKSPSYPAAYGIDCSCTWKGLVDNSNSFIKVTFSVFKLQDPSAGLCLDYIAIYDGSSVDESKRLAKLCGSNIPGEVKSSGNIISIVFKSDSSSGTLEDGGFVMALTAEKNKDELAGLQSVAAILGAISFGIFIGLLICSVLYKRWSNDRTEVEVEHDPANDYDDAIQQAAPPSYRKVMAEPELYPATPITSPETLSRGQNSVRLPSVDPPDYPGADEHIEGMALEVLPPLPSYDVVSESEDDWVAVKNTRSARPKKVIKSTLVGLDGNPPCYNAVTSEGSENEGAAVAASSKNRGRLQSRSQRTSTSNMYQARSNPSDSDSDEDQGDGATRMKRSQRSLSVISSESDVDPLDPIIISGGIEMSPLGDGRTSSNSSDSSGQERVNVLRTRARNDLVRHAIHNSIGKSGLSRSKMDGTSSNDGTNAGRNS